MDRQEKLKIRYKNLPQYKTLTEEQLDEVVKSKVEQEELADSFVGLNDDERKKALILYNRYLEENSFTNLAEKSSLITLISLELLKERMQILIKKESDQNQGAIPMRVVEQILEVETKIMELKKNLGMLKDKQDSSMADALDELYQKALKYYEENAGCTTARCPHCSKFFNLLMDVRNLEPAKATFFKGTMLYNHKLFELYDKKVISTEEMAEILNVSVKGIFYIHTNLYLKDKKC